MSNYVECPFCDEADFDLVGLKHAARKLSFSRCCPATALTEQAHFDGREMRRMTYGELFQLRYGESLPDYIEGLGR